MKKAIALYLFVGVMVLLPLACSDNNSPSKPTSPGIGGGGGSSTPTFTGTIPTATNTPTPTPTGVAVSTATPTWTWIATPPYLNNYGTSAAPNGMYYDATGAILYVAEAESMGTTTVTALEQFGYLGGGSFVFGTMGNQMIVGQATPCAVYQPTPYTVSLTTVSFPVGVAVSSPSGLVGGSYPGYIEVLDLQSSGAASLYAEDNYLLCPSALYGGPFENATNGFGGAAFSNPKCLTGDALGHFYVADTGNGYVEEFDGGGAVCNPLCSPAWLHRWNGPGPGYPSNMNFIKPNTVACDSSNNVYVGDSGPYGATNTSMVQVYTSGGTTLLAAVTLIQNCQINGLTVDPTGQYFYVSDSSNGQVEEYQFIPFPFVAASPSTQVGLVRAWGDPHSYHEFQPYKPACLQIIGSYVVVSDQGNNFLNVFGP